MYPTITTRSRQVRNINATNRLLVFISGELKAIMDVFERGCRCRMQWRAVVKGYITPQRNRLLDAG
jgi:hypothetical protein